MTLFVPNKFPPPEQFNPQEPFNTLWEEEIFRKGLKAMRVSVSKINEQLMVGVGNWYFNMKKQDWLPSNGQVNLPIDAWKKLMKNQTIIDDKIEEEILWDALTPLSKGVFLFSPILCLFTFCIPLTCLNFIQNCNFIIL